MEKQWLIRRTGEPIVIGGPYWTDQVREMVSCGNLDSDDELCQENGYWFALHENSELMKLLGTPRAAKGGTPTRNLREEETAPDLEVTPIDVLKAAGAGKIAPSVSASMRRLKVTQPLALRSAGEFSSRTRIWVGVLYLAVIAAILGVLWVLKALDT